MRGEKTNGGRRDNEPRTGHGVHNEQNTGEAPGSIKKAHPWSPGENHGGWDLETHGKPWVYRGKMVVYWGKIWWSHYDFTKNID